MTATVLGWTGVPRAWLFDADLYTKSEKGWTPLFIDTDPLWSRVAEGRKQVWS